MPRKPSILLAAAGAALALALSAAPASAQAPPADLEGVWSFNGGQVAVQQLPDGTFEGTIIRPTLLAECVHPIGEKMWVGVRAVGDGSYHGGHQWFRTFDCSPIARRGNSAFRVLPGAEGGHFLRACFSPPERPDEQPTIAPDGATAPSSARCYDSDLIQPLPTGAPRLRAVARLPRARKACRIGRRVRVRVREPRGDALATVVILVDGRPVRRLSGEDIAGRVIVRTPRRGRYRVRVRATTVLGHRVSGARSYRTCSLKQRRHVRRARERRG